jgi:hypothetical protein
MGLHQRFAYILIKLTHVFHSIMLMLGFPVSSGVVSNLNAPGYVKS